MATIKQFEDLVCWQRARELTREVYRAFGQCRDSGFRDQIQRASVSIMSNVAEGFERGTRQEFLNYLFIAKGSAGEVRAQLYAACDIGYINMQTFKYLNGLAEDCSRLLQSFVYKVKAGGQAGLQYKRETTKAQRERQEFEEYLAWHIKEKEKSPELAVSEEGLKEFIRLKGG